MNLLERPLEINRAGYQELLRIPGIGPKGVKSILSARRQGSILHDLSDLKDLGINTSRAAPYILFNGRRPAYQPSLW